MRPCRSGKAAHSVAGRPGNLSSGPPLPNPLTEPRIVQDATSFLPQAPSKEYNMDDHLKLAIQLATAQASVRVMEEEEMVNMIRSLTASLKKMADNTEVEDEEEVLAAQPARSIKEKTITCLECGKVFKLITSKHLAQHGLDADAYRHKWGLKPDTPLVCKSLQRTRRKKMKDMKLWEKRKSVQ